MQLLRGEHVAKSIHEFAAALEARATTVTTVITLETGSLRFAPDSLTWRDVPVATVPTDPAT